MDIKKRIERIENHIFQEKQRPLLKFFDSQMEYDNFQKLVEQGLETNPMLAVIRPESDELKIYRDSSNNL